MPETTWGQMREEAEAQGFTPLPVGTWNAKVDKAEVVAGKTSPQIKARFVVLDGVPAGKSTYTRLAPRKNDGDVNGMFFQQMAALGFPKESPLWGQVEQMEFEQGLQYMAQQIMDKPCIIEVDHQPYMGEMRDNIKRIKPYGQGGPVPGGPVVGGQGVPQAPIPQQPQPQQPQAPSPVAVPAAPAPAPQAPQQPVAQPQAPQQPVAAPQTPQAAPAPQAAPETPQPDAAPQQPVAQPGVPQVPQPPQPVTDTEAPF